MQEMRQIGRMAVGSEQQLIGSTFAVLRGRARSCALLMTGKANSVQSARFEEEPEMTDLNRESAAAKEDAQRKLARYAAGILRTISGSTYDVYSLRHSLADFLDAQKLLLSSRGSELTTKEEREALDLPRLDPDLSSDRPRLMFETGNRLIVEGALRLAAHQILGQCPHFGGKYSQQLIEKGIEFRKGRPDSPQEDSSSRKPIGKKRRFLRRGHSHKGSG